MNEKIIRLKVHPKDFEEIYFSGNQGSLFFSPTTKAKTITTVVVAIVLLVVLLFKDSISQDKFGIVYFISFLLLLCAVYLSLAINKVSRWKKSVLHYLKTIENSNLYELKFDEKYFNVSIDEKEELNTWEDFSYSEITPNFISLEGKHSYMFPKKSMTEKDFTLLKQTVKKYIK